MNHICNVIDAEIVGKCGVSTCMWHTEDNAEGCIKDGLSNTAAFAHVKGIGASSTDRTKKLGILKVQRIILLYNYLNFVYGISTKIEIPFKNEELLEYYAGLISKYPLDLTELELRWTPLLLALALDKKMYAAFVNQKVDGTIPKTQISIHQVIGMTKTQLKTAMSNRSKLFRMKQLNLSIKGVLHG